MTEPIMPNISGRPLVVAHRGGAGLRPENTLSSFKYGCELGADAIEFDVLATADGHLVVHHDYKLNPAIARAADGSWISSSAPPAIKDLTLAQLKSYDVGRLKPGTPYAAQYPEQVAADGERIPTFNEAIGLLKESSNLSTRLFVEIKTSPEEPDLALPPEDISNRVVGLVREAGIADRTSILSFDWRNLMHIQKIAPEIMTVFLTIDTPRSSNLKPGQIEPSPWLAGIDIKTFNGSAPKAVRAAGGGIWAPFYRNLNSENLAEARQSGLTVAVWTPDTPEDLLQMINMKVDAITTNRPDVLLKILKN